MASFKLHLFGPPRFIDGSTPVDIRPRKALALLVYLAVTQQPHSRDALATLLWPESDQTAARGSLRRTLHRLQQALPSGIIDASTDTIQLGRQVDLWVDTHAYQAILNQCLPALAPVDQLDASCYSRLAQAAQLYVDDFLAGFTLEDAPSFDEWQFFQQESLRRSATQLLDQLQHTCAERGDYGAAIDHARRRLTLDTLHEPAHRQLMRLYYWAGQHAAALRQYQECLRLLDEELGVPPEEETTALFEAIRTKRLPMPAPVATPQPQAPAAAPSQPPDAAAQAPQIDPSPPNSSSPSSSLTRPITPFIGRTGEVERISALLAHEQECRFLVLVGPSGIGKSRLALQVAHALADMQPVPPFASGIHLINLEADTTTADLLAALIATLGLPSGSLAAKQQVVTFLRDKQILLVIDQLEHLQDDTQLLIELLTEAPGVKILATSVTGVRLQEAWLFPVGSLSYPTTLPDDPDRLLRYDAVRLFEERARRVRINFSLEAEAPHVVRICQLVEGMPLALELAATWLTVLNPQHIAAEISRGLDILTARDQNIPQRHRSMRAVLDQSWALLAPDERSIFARLAIFQDGFTAAAARAVAGANMLQLASLVDKSLLQLNDAGRYTIHELLRQYAAEQLRADPANFAAAQKAHADYFIAFLAACSRDIKTARQREALQEITDDHANILEARTTIIEQGRYAEGIDATLGLWLFNHYRGNLSEGEQAADRAIAKLQSAPSCSSSDDKARTVLLAVLTAELGWFKARRGNADGGRPLIEQSIEQLRAAGERNTPIEAFTVAYLAMTAQYQGRYDEARKLAQQSLESYTRLNNQWGIAMTLEVLGTAVLGLGQFDEARQILQAALTAAQASGDQRLVLLCSSFLGIIAVHRGDYNDAEERLNQALSIGETLGDRLGTSTTLIYLANLALYRGQFALAEDYLTRSRQIRHNAGVNYDSLRRELLSTTYRAQGKNAAAERVAREALQQAQTPRRIASALHLLAMLAYDRQEYSQAEQMQQQALERFREIKHAPREAMAICQLGHIALATQRADAAQRYYIQALQLARQYVLAPTALDCMVGIARLSLLVGDSAYAERLLDFILQHPAATYETLQQAKTLRDRLTALPIAAGEAMSSRLWHATDWLRLAKKIETRFSEPARPQSQPRTRNLPAQATPFIGREQEVQDVTNHLLNPDCRLLTIVGLGGIGKTRLAIQVAQHLVGIAHPAETPPFADGIIFVPLVSALDASGLVTAIAEAVGVTTASSAPPRQQLLNALANKDLLLILDNFEHLLDATPLLGEILATSPKIKLLVTSHVALDLPEAWFYPLGGMSFPPTPAEDSALEAYESVQLFAHAARRARPGFVLSGTLELVAQICRLVEGMPLAIELVATWLKILPLEAIVQEIRGSSDILTAHQSSLPRRHRSMRVVIEHSWTLLSEDEQKIFMALAIFRGGFRREAAHAVAGAGLSTLAALVEKSFLTLSEKGRYSIHELLRQFALEKMAAQPDLEAAIKAHFNEYYLTFLESRQSSMIGPHQQTVLSEIAEEIDNVQLIWQWALEHDDLTSLERAMQPYKHYLWVRGRGHVGQEVFRHALHVIQQSARARNHPRFAAVHQQFCQELGAFTYFVGDLTEAANYLEQALAEAKRLGNQRTIGAALNTLGTVYAWLGRPAEGEKRLQAALAIAKETNNINGVADVTHELSRVAMFVGDYPLSRARAEESLFYARQLARKDWIGYPALTIGGAEFYLGNYEAAQRSIEEGLAAFSSIGHILGTALGWGALAWLYWATAGATSPEAESYSQRSLEAVRRIGHRLQIAHRLAQLAQIANDRGDYVAAARHSQEGAEIAEALPNPLYLSQNLAYRAEAAYRTGDFATARRCLSKACSVAQSAQFHSRTLLVIYHAAELLLHEAEQAHLSQTQQQAHRTEAMRLLSLCYSHPATWHVQRQRAAQHLLNPQLLAQGHSPLLPSRQEVQALAEEVADVAARLIAWSTPAVQLPPLAA